MPALLRFGGCIRQQHLTRDGWGQPTVGRGGVGEPSADRAARATASLGSTLDPLRTGWSCSSEGMGMHRDCPSLTAVGRCEGTPGARLRRLRHYGRSLELDRSVSARMRCRVRWPIRLMAALVSA
jgi:hypothetical protein